METSLKKVVVGGGPMLNKFKRKYKEVDFLGYKKGKNCKYLQDAACLFFLEDRYIWHCFN